MPVLGCDEAKGAAHMRSFLTGLAIALLLVTSAFAFDGKKLHYEIDWGPATLADLNIQLLESQSIRSVSAEINSRGVGAWFSDFQATLEVMRIDDGALLLNGDSAWGKVLSSITVTWPEDESKPLVDFYRSQPRDYELSPVPVDLMNGTVDPSSILFDLKEKLDQSNRCEGFYRVFDGIRRYDLQVTQGSVEVLRAEDIDDYSGEAYRCEISMIRHGGFSVKRSLVKFDESEITRTLYFANIKGQWLPVRFEIELPFGRATARLKVTD